MNHLEQLPDLDQGDYKPLYVQLSDLLADFIRGNGLEEGDLLPSENELLLRYNISRSTIRQAMQHLENQEVVRKIRGKGTFVSSPPHKKCFRGFQNLEETLAKKGVTLTNVLLRWEQISPPSECARALHLSPNIRAWFIQRLKMVDKEPLAFEERFLPLEIGKRFREEDFREKPIFDVIETQPDLEITRVIYTMAVARLTDEQLKVLKVDRDAPVLRRTGVYLGRNSRPLMYGMITFLADKTELRFEFQKTDDLWGIISVT